MNNNYLQHTYEQAKFGEPWFTYKNLYKSWVEELQDDSIIVEIGCWKGKSLAYLCTEIINSNKNIKVYAVDTWMGCIGEQNLYNTFPEVVNNTVYDIFMENMKPFMAVLTPLRMDSIEASALFQDNSIDRVFIDGCHTYEAVLQDIESWLPKIKIKGKIAGHDIHSEPIKQAVNDSSISKTNLIINSVEGYFLSQKEPMA
jgi:hypothetical protein